MYTIYTWFFFLIKKVQSVKVLAQTTARLVWTFFTELWCGQTTIQAKLVVKNCC